MNRLFRWLAAATTSVLTAMRHVGAGNSFSTSLLNRTGLNYQAMVRPDQSSVVIACIRWVQRTFTEAPAMLELWAAERQEWGQVQRDPFLELLERPNPFYNGATLWKATIADLMTSGSAYWLKVRSRSGRPVELWWAPETTIEPKGTDSEFITHYEYRPGTGDPILLREQDVVHFRDGMDPGNPRKGCSAMRSLFREIFTDDEAANMTASLLRNMGVPGIVISPDAGVIGKDAGNQLKAAFMEAFTGDRKGEPIITGGAIKLAQFGFSPEQMQLRSLRGIPEERITAVLGVNAAVVGLGAGLATTKVGATLREYREEAFESTIIPLYRELASELTHQLLGDFKAGADWRVAFDLTNVRVLQDDENKRHERIRSDVAAGIITVAEGRRQMRQIALPEHEVYLRDWHTVAVPAGLTPEEQQAANEPSPAGGQGQNAAAPAA